MRVGTGNGNAKPNDEIVITIYNEYKSGTSIKELSIKYDVSTLTVERLLSGKSWKHIKLDISALFKIKQENKKARLLRWKR